MCLNINIDEISVPRSYKTMISIPSIVRIKIKDRFVIISGELGELTHILHKLIDVQINNEKHFLMYVNNINNKMGKSLIGTTRALISNMITGVTVGFIKKLQLVGIGYRVIIRDNNIINLTIGLSHSINYVLPPEITVICPNQTEIVLTGINKQLIGQVAADLRALRPPEPFKGKGIRYMGEIVYSKDTKKK